MYVQFDPRYAHWWKESPSTQFKFIRMSRSGSSAWIERHGQEECIIADILLTKCPKCGEMKKLVDPEHFVSHFPPPPPGIWVYVSKL